MQSNSDRVEQQSPAAQRSACLQQLLETSKTGGVDALAALQSQAAALVSELAIPSTRDEAWRFTDLSKLVAAEFVAADGEAAVAVERSRLLLCRKLKLAALFSWMVFTALGYLT
ncbi:MAG: hypothetical protein HC824_09920 [Synechococcales cyanobacterium RM1_1_8]|nr:hypothetical protein [Synechococcales cyanobacterium RM1_1_8]